MHWHAVQSKPWRTAPDMDRRPVMKIVIVLIGLIVLGLLAIGAFPPSVTQTAVERVVPNDRFQTR